VQQYNKKQDYPVRRQVLFLIRWLFFI